MKSVTDQGEEDQNIENMLPIMPFLQPSLVITEEASLVPETLSLKDHKNIEVR